MYVTFYGMTETNACELYVQWEKIYYACCARKNYRIIYSIRCIRFVVYKRCLLNAVTKPSCLLYSSYIKKKKIIREFSRYKCNQKSLCYTKRVGIDEKRRKYFVNIALCNEDNSGVTFRIIQRRGGRFPNGCKSMSGIGLVRKSE